MTCYLVSDDARLRRRVRPEWISDRPISGAILVEYRVAKQGGENVTATHDSLNARALRKLSAMSACRSLVELEFGVAPYPDRHGRIGSPMRR